MEYFKMVALRAYVKPIPTTLHNRARHTQTGNISTFSTGHNTFNADDHHGIGRQPIGHRTRNQIFYSDQFV
jgi:hypothetical protein